LWIGFTYAHSDCNPHSNRNTNGYVNGKCDGNAHSYGDAYRVRYSNSYSKCHGHRDGYANIHAVRRKMHSDATASPYSSPPPIGSRISDNR
jgi:hypothetical protein